MSETVTVVRKPVQVAAAVADPRQLGSVVGGVGDLAGSALRGAQFVGNYAAGNLGGPADQVGSMMRRIMTFGVGTTMVVVGLIWIGRRPLQAVVAGGLPALPGGKAVTTAGAVLSAASESGGVRKIAKRGVKK